MVRVLSDQNSIANDFLRELRDTNIQTDRLRFRTNLTRLGSIMAYEISRALPYHTTRVTSPLGSVDTAVLREQPVVLTILRAGLPYFEGFHQLFDRSDCGFIGAYRKEGGKEVTIKLDYLATPSLKGRTVILTDPMLATGRSTMDAVKAMLHNGEPSHLHIASVIAAPEGIAHLQQQLTVPHTLWTFAIDEKLDEKYYIVPGLGDAGDLSFGEKL